MSAWEEDDMVHDAVLWPATGLFNDDGEPQVDMDNPIPLKVRWTFANDEATDNSGNTVGINAQAKVDRRIPIHSKMWKGKLEDWESRLSAEVMKVVMYDEADDVRGEDTTRVVKMQWFRGNPPPVGV